MVLICDVFFDRNKMYYLVMNLKCNSHLLIDKCSIIEKTLLVNDFLVQINYYKCNDEDNGSFLYMYVSGEYVKSTSMV